MSQLDVDDQALTAPEDGRPPIVGDPGRVAVPAADPLGAQSQRLREIAGGLAVAALALAQRPPAGEAPGAAGPATDGAVAWVAGHSGAIRSGPLVALPLAGGGVPVVA
jgi:hypothetical protein